MPTKKDATAPKKSGFQLPEPFAPLPGLIASHIATLAARGRFETLQQDAEQEIKAFAESGDVENLAAVGAIVARQTQLTLIPARVAFLDDTLAQLDRQLGTGFQALRASLVPLVNEIRRGHAETYAQRNKDDGIPLLEVRQHAFDNLPKAKEAASYEHVLNRRNDGDDNAGSVADLLGRLETWTSERDALAAQLGGTIPGHSEFFNVAPAPVLTYGGKEVSQAELAELQAEESRIRSVGWELKERAKRLRNRNHPRADGADRLGDEMLKLVAGSGDTWTPERVRAVEMHIADFETRLAGTDLIEH